jgi:hypothetical protein
MSDSKDKNQDSQNFLVLRPCPAPASPFAMADATAVAQALSVFQLIVWEAFADMT